LAANCQAASQHTHQGLFSVYFCRFLFAPVDIFAIADLDNLNDQHRIFNRVKDAISAPPEYW
jgi:hypothetical protein